MSAVAPREERQGAASRALVLVLSALNGLGTLWVLLLLVLINADVVSRNLFNAPIDGVIEIIELSLVAIVFLQLGDATRRGRLTRSDSFLALLMARSPRAGRMLAAAFDLLGATFMAIILYGTWPLFLDAAQKGHYVGNAGVFTAPTWPIKLIMMIGCVMTILQFASVAWRLMRGVEGRHGAA
ncbi:MAG: TRAP transporter small permease subunit [Rhodospirillales bacterium]